MKRSKFSQMLEAQRNTLGHSQITTAGFLFITQSAYSRIESGKTKVSIARSQEIIKLLEPHGYQGIPPIEVEETDGVPSITIRWPFGKYSFYALLVVVILMAVDYVANGPADIARGLSAGEKGEPDPDNPTGIMYMIFAGIAIIYGIYRLIKKWRQ